MSDRIENQFLNNIERVWSIHALHHQLTNMTTDALDLTDLLRTEIVLSVSAFDYYVHEIVKYYMIESFKGSRIQTQAFLNNQIKTEVLLSTISNPPSSNYFENEIIERHGWKSFQHPNNVADAIRLISDVSLWNEVGTYLSVPPADIKKKLSLIIDRRNKIAHESDMDPSFPNQRWPIDRILAEDSVNFIKTITLAIHEIVK